MKKLHGSTLWAALVLFSLAGHSHDLSLQVEIKPALVTVRQNEDFSVETAIRNTGSQPETIEVWSCSYPRQWTLENQAGKVKQIGCKKNYVEQVKLNPGEAYSDPHAPHGRSGLHASAGADHVSLEIQP